MTTKNEPEVEDGDTCSCFPDGCKCGEDFCVCKCVCDFDEEWMEKSN